MSFAYGFGLPHWQPLSGGFSPAGLFQAGVIGTFYDPSDRSTLFTTSTGTTPCAVPGSGSQVLVGLMLDKSQGAPGALGAELVTNGDFSQGSTGWTPGAGWSIAGGVAIGAAANTNLIQSNVAPSPAGKTYRVTLTIVTRTTGSIFPQIGGSVVTLSAAGTYTFYLTPTLSDPTFYIPGNNFTGTITNISIRQIPGNHAIAFNDTTARPELSARVNLVTYSEDWTNAVWQKLQSGTGVAPVVTNNFATAPDGTQTATRVQFNLGATPATAVSRLFQNAADNVTVARTKTVWAKTNDNSTKNIYIQGPQSGNTLLTVTPAWTLFTISDTSTTVSAYSQMQLGLDGSQGTSTTADILFWHPDIRQTNIGSAIPSYQRIADQYTYDSNGFPSYLRFDGVDDSMYTPASINFSGTDKMSVFAGVRKLSDAAGAILAELSASAGANNGAFYIAAPTAALPDFGFLSRGTAAQLVTASPYAAPVTVVATGIGDIAGAVSAIRVNGSQVGINTTSQGTGNYGTYPLYIGSRNNTSARFNGHLYSLIIAGTQLQSGSITATEQYVAGKTGVQI